MVEFRDTERGKVIVVYKKDTSDGTGDFFAGLALGALVTISTVVVAFMFERDLKKEAIDRGFAEYNSKTGAWCWVERKEAGSNGDDKKSR